MALDTQLLADIGKSAPDFAGAKARAYTLADAINTQQMGAMQLQQAKTEQADLAKISGITRNYDLADPEQRHKAAADVQQKVGGKYAMDFLRQTNEMDRQSAQLTSESLKNYQAKHEILNGAILPMYQQVQTMTQQGVPPQQIEAQLLPVFKQALQAIQGQTLPNGEKVLNKDDIQAVSTMLSGQPGALVGGINKIMASSLTNQKALADLQMRTLKAQNIESEIAHRGTQEKQAEKRLDVAANKGREGEPLSEDAVRMAAERIVAGEPRSSVISGYGRGAQGAENIRKVDNMVAQLTKGKGGAAITAAGVERAGRKRTELELARREGSIATAVQEAQNFANIALDVSRKVPRRSFLPWSQLSQYTDKQLQDPNLAAFKAATLSLVNAYTRAVGGGTAHVADKEHANAMLNTAQSPEAYEAVVKQLITETESALSAPGQVRQRMNQPQTPAPTSPSPTAAPSPAAPGAGGGGTSPKATHRFNPVTGQIEAVQ